MRCVKVTVDMSGFKKDVVDWTPAIKAMQEALLTVRNTWERAVMGEKLPGMTRKIHNETYAQSLHRTGAIQSFSPVHGEVTTDYRGADRIEEGSAPRDMKPALLNGPHAKIPGRLAIVPFRHGTPGSSAHYPSTPKDVYNMARRLSYYRSGGSGTRQLGDLTKQDPTKYPAKTKTFFMHLASAIDHSAEHGRMATYTHTTSIYSHMVKAGRAKYSQYLTFRAVSINSNPASWWYPAVAPNPVREAVIRSVQKEIEDILEAGWTAALS